MSSVIDPRADSQEEIRRQLEAATESWEKSCQAHGDVTSPRHNDGERIYQDFSIPPLHRFLAKAERHEKAVAQYPSAFVDCLVHTSGRDIELLEALAEEGSVEYDPKDPHPSHDALERYPPLRAKMLEWLAADSDRIKNLSDGGTDLQVHGPPSRGKSTFAMFAALTMQQVNNETFLWAETLDESGTNERTEWLPLAPWTTIALPADLPVEVRIAPEDPTVDPFVVEPEEVVRDVIRYESPRDLLGKLMPGQFYVVYPDPLFRGCEDVSPHAFHSYRDVTPRGEEGPDQPTPADEWWFAFVAARITQDEFLHPTTINLDEAGNTIDPDASRGVHDSYDKIRWLRNKYADARKKGVSFIYQTHALAGIHRHVRAKQRWWLTTSRASPPIGKQLPGEKKCPMTRDYTRNMDRGQGTIWNTVNYAPIEWPNIKRQARLDAEISIDFLTWGEVAR